MDVNARVVALVLEYSHSPPTGLLDPKATLRNDLGVDLVEWGTDLGKLVTLEDLMALAHALARASPSKRGQ